MIGCNLELRPTFRLRMVRECSVCRQEMNEERARKEQIVAAIFGNAAYAVCCCCGQQVLDRKDRNYRYRWRRWARKIAELAPRVGRK